MTDNHGQDESIQDLLSYCSRQEIFFHQGVSPKRVPGRGLGIYCTSKIKKGERIVHVPTAALFATENVPVHFASKEARKKVPVHALLAAYFAFGPKDELALLNSWLKTWPLYGDFAGTVPLMWPARTRNDADTQETKRAQLPPPITGSYITNSNELKTSKNGSTTLVDSQARKLAAHIQVLEAVLPPDIHAGLQDPASEKYYKYLHAWLCVNTRCFSYTPHGKKRPKDPNEAMALCPGMDLFNHAAKPNVMTKYDKSGYFATALRTLQPEEEIFFNYGRHVNDVLWTEYGFLLDENPEDAIRIDKIVLAGLDEAQKVSLEEQGYMDEYWLSASGICYRTEVVAWLCVLPRDDWLAMLEGKYDPEDDQSLAQNGKRTIDGHKKQAQSRLKAHRIICATWVDRVETDASAALQELECMSEDTITDHFGDGADALEIQQQAFSQEKTKRKQLNHSNQQRASQRHAMCIKRWEQLRDMAAAAKASMLLD